MCGIFGLISSSAVVKSDLEHLAKHAMQRGKDSSGLLTYDNANYSVVRADYDVVKLLIRTPVAKATLVVGHSRLITNGLSDNQPVVRDSICVFHNGIIVNDAEVWDAIQSKRMLEIDSEVIAAIAQQYLQEHGDDLQGLAAAVLTLCKGVVACAIIIPKLGKAVIFSNNGSLYLGQTNKGVCFSSESYPLSQIGCTGIVQVREQAVILDVPVGLSITVSDDNKRSHNIIPPFKYNQAEEKLLAYHSPELRRCTKCILPETMPFISFDTSGVCNYCHTYKLRNIPKPKEELFKLVEPYRRNGALDCIVPFSGGRDSCYGLHLIVKELEMNPVTYTYDWYGDGFRSP